MEVLLPQAEAELLLHAAQEHAALLEERRLVRPPGARGLAVGPDLEALALRPRDEPRPEVAEVLRQLRGLLVVLAAAQGRQLRRRARRDEGAGQRRPERRGRRDQGGAHRCALVPAVEESTRAAPRGPRRRAARNVCEDDAAEMFDAVH